MDKYVYMVKGFEYASSCASSLDYQLKGWLDDQGAERWEAVGFLFPTATGITVVFKRKRDEE